MNRTVIYQSTLNDIGLPAGIGESGRARYLVIEQEQGGRVLVPVSHLGSFKKALRDAALYQDREVHL